MTRASLNFVLAAALGLALAEPAIADQAADVAAARAGVARALKDPASARFAGVKAKPGAVCGTVNARNGFGGYTGPTLFVYVTASREAFILDPAGTSGPNWAARAIAAYQGHCS